MYKLTKFQNTSQFSNEKPTIVIDDSDPNWTIILQTWQKGGNPTNSTEWKKGVFACFKWENQNDNK